MSLAPGTRLGAYEIVGLIGAGGMGEVYRARDTRLKREVAIKILPGAFANDSDRLARFQREAELLATLNHPGIGAVYGLEKAEGTSAIVLELIEGDTLADRLRSGPLPFDGALNMAHQIAEALEAAHEKGIVHRDLKPANIKITPDEKVKVLDFGLAKAMEPAGSKPQDPAYGLSHAPTVSMMATQAGMILGTAAYMSPEQAKGFPADQRSDIFSFGSVLYEMLTGRQPFKGDTAQEILASVLVHEPDLGALPPNLNPRLHELIKRCLDKNPKQRWQAVGDLRVEIETIAAAPRNLPVTAERSVAAPRSFWKWAFPIVVAAMGASVLTGVTAWTLRPVLPPAAVTRFSVALLGGESFTSTTEAVLALSPDGTQIAWVANNQLYLRSMSDIEARPIPGTSSSGTNTPVFSPDSRSLAFISNGTLKRIAITGGGAVTIGQVDRISGMTWGADGIVYGLGTKGVMRVSASGGTPERLVDGKEGELVYGPQVLPGGQAVLFTLSSGPSADLWDKARIVVQTIGTGERKALVEGGSDARYLPTGHIVYALGGTLMAVPFDVRRLQVTAGPMPVVDGVRRSLSGVTGMAQFSVSDTGSLIYLPGPGSLTVGQLDIGLTDRKGTVQPMKFSPGKYEYPRVSPDGKRIAFGTDDSKEAIVWIFELAGTSSMRRLTFVGRNRFPIWSADSQRVAFQSDRDGDVAIYWQAADGTGAAERLTKPEQDTSHIPESWSPRDGQLLYSAIKGDAASLWTLSVHDKTAKPFGGVRSSGGNQIAAVFSPDGRWVAYSSNETGLVGENNVYVQPFPATGAKYLVSQAGENGHHPVWSPDGKELLYIPQVGQFVAVTVTTQPSFSFGNKVSVPRAFPVASPVTPRTFDMTPDGNIASVITVGQSQPGSAVQQFQVVLNWQEELTRLVPTK